MIELQKKVLSDIFTIADTKVAVALSNCSKYLEESQQEFNLRLSLNQGLDAKEITWDEFITRMKVDKHLHEMKII